MIFDVVRLYGVDLTHRPLSERRATLERLELSGSHWQVPPAYDDGAALLAATGEQGLEGVVSKRRSSIYQPGRRSKDWIKFPHRRVESCLVGGWRPEVDSTTRLGAVLVGLPQADGLGYAGRVGSGIAGVTQAELTRLLAPLRIDHSPFAEPVPPVDARGSTWCEPRIVIDVAHLGRTGAGRLRQPSVRGIRLDLDPADLVAGDPDAAEPGEA
jgi:bifunctional non-homologous end joining protein LigD